VRRCRHRRESALRANQRRRDERCFPLDEPLFQAARRRLDASGRQLGYSLAYLDGKCSCEFNFDEQGFAQMGAVLEDHGTWEHPAHYFASDRYVAFGALQRWCLPLVASLSNRNIRRLRASRHNDT
jgi:hypothetical protein